MSTKSDDKDQPQDKPLLDQESYDDLMKKLNEAEEKNGQYWDRILRLQAEMDNVSKRFERELANAHKYALEKFVGELLPVIDNLERALTASKDSKAEALAVIEGVSLTLKMLYDVLEKSGVKQVNPGEKDVFNPAFHEAISMQEAAGCKPGMVVSVLQKGYLLNERLVRPALVVVSK